MSVEELNIEGGGTLRSTPSCEDLIANFSQNDASETGAPSRQTAGEHLELIFDLNLPASVRLGKSRLTLKELVKLGPGSVIPLDRNADDPLDLYINDKKIAEGVIVVKDGRFALRITQIQSKADRIRSLG